MLFYSIALLVFICDQVIKYFVIKSMVLFQSIPVFGELVKLTYVRNTGAAFSIFVGFSSYLMVIGLLVAAAVVYFHHRMATRNDFAQIALAFIFGGSLGNIFDRFYRGFVIDYIDVGFWPVFNLADVMINFGVAMLIADLLMRKGRDVSGLH